MTDRCPDCDQPEDWCQCPPESLLTDDEARAAIAELRAKLGRKA